MCSKNYYYNILDTSWTLSAPNYSRVKVDTSDLIMGKNRHSKDRMFITTTEWKTEYGGKKTAGNIQHRPLPFECCALSLSPFETPCCTQEGVIFDFLNLVPYLRKHKSNPITAVEMTTKDIIRLNMEKNSEGAWHCPVTCKVFTNSTHIVAIRNTGNVYAYDAVSELNLKTRNMKDLLTDEPFLKSDIITLQDPSNAEHVALRDINNFKHLKIVREETIAAKDAENKVRHNPASESVMREIEKKRKADDENGLQRKTYSISDTIMDTHIEDVACILALQPTTADINPGSNISEQKASRSLTSSAVEVVTTSTTRLATPEEIREARWKMMRRIGKKAYLQMQTNIGNINIELHCDMSQKTCWNFIKLCQNEYYDGIAFHRLIENFMIQGGDPSGTGSGGDSAFGGGKAFRDEFDSRLSHDKRGILSMANSGKDTNRSQVNMCTLMC